MKNVKYSHAESKSIGVCDEKSSLQHGSWFRTFKIHFIQNEFSNFQFVFTILNISMNFVLSYIDIKGEMRVIYCA